MTPPESWTELISIETVNSLQLRGLEKHGGSAGPAKAGCVEGSIGNAWTAEYYFQAGDGEHFVPGLIFAAHLLFYLAKNHCYTDGNKRVAWSSCMAVLGRLGLTVDASADAAEEFVTSIADGRFTTVEPVLNWVAARLVALDVTTPPARQRQP